MTTERRFEPFECAPGLRLDAHEALTDLRITGIQERLSRLEAAMERLERRLWLTVYGIVAMILAEAAQSLLGLN
jgi:hypothetical protein